jgi:MFS transporter, DHA3 family, macrolide efflux protein
MVERGHGHGHGLRTFSVIWGGQVLSMLGSNMTRFALAIWAWDRTGAATPLVLVGVFTGVSGLLAKIVAGPLVDRWNRQRIMIVSDSIAGLLSVVILLLYMADQLQVWHLYVMAAVFGWVGTFQGLAFTTSVTMLIPKTH